MSYQISMLTVLVLVLGLYFYSVHRMDQLRKQYHNDERWQTIRLRASAVAKSYYQWIIVIASIGIIVLLFKSGTVLVSLERMLTIAVLIIMFGYVIEYLAIRRLDRMM